MAPEEPHREVRTERLLIRPLSREDAVDIHLIRSSPVAMKFTPTLAETDVQQSKDWIEKCLTRDNCYNFSLELLGSEKEATDSNPEPKRRVIGVIGAIRTPEIGYMIHPDYWGKGIMTEAMRGFMPLFWEHVEGRYDYATAIVDPDHAPSRRILEKLGFTVYEYREKDFDSPHLGIRDSVIYRLFRPGASTENAKGLS